ncbi:TetR/AcrR family transcriptional regulator [Mucilaginibacter sp. SMC90]|uniref:TetR/AcrR family transcriptional regulator n=1 Tax=Mucilaginibacter sp. SMC90 TaxID=2929803 RepID=UPI001FB39129|nr:TetR/AcrR family transcriptional regulator [Mucilaginibacter sp. SMC90]UOE49368.1 TetR/AcrR family transcriptional regulator [Mucilaginibacter sp. SMC90]
MGSKERILRLKELTRRKILKAALSIVRQEGWQALSMRRIADEIDYTAPVIYEYFKGKEELIGELSATGFKTLAAAIRIAKNSAPTAPRKLEAMWQAYWNFAFAEKELYQAMFGVEVSCSSMKEGFAKDNEIPALFGEVLKELMRGRNTAEEQISTKYYTMWSAVHGLVSINLVNKGRSEAFNQAVLHEAIGNTIRPLVS